MKDFGTQGNIPRPYPRNYSSLIRTVFFSGQLNVRSPKSFIFHVGEIRPELAFFSSPKSMSSLIDEYILVTLEICRNSLFPFGHADIK